jgi:hypothetical protein
MEGEVSVVGIDDATLNQDIIVSSSSERKEELTGSRKDEVNAVQNDAPIDIAIRQFVFLPPDEVPFFPIPHAIHSYFLTIIIYIGDTCCRCIISKC